MKKVWLMLGTSEPMNPLNTAALCNWAEDRAIFIREIVSGFMPATNQFQMKAGQAIPVLFVYASTSDENFKKVFGFEYTLENLTKVPAFINDSIKAEVNAAGAA